MKPSNTRSRVLRAIQSNSDKEWTAREGSRASFYLSRNEAKVAAADGHWSLVVVRRLAPETFTVVGWCTIGVLSPHLPSDRGAGRWASTHVTLPDSALQPGLPVGEGRVEVPASLSESVGPWS